MRVIIFIDLIFLVSIYVGVISIVICVCKCFGVLYLYWENVLLFVGWLGN